MPSSVCETCHAGTPKPGHKTQMLKHLHDAAPVRPASVRHIGKASRLWPIPRGFVCARGKGLGGSHESGAPDWHRHLSCCLQLPPWFSFKHGQLEFII